MENKFFKMNILDFFKLSVNTTFYGPKYILQYNVGSETLPFNMLESPNNEDIYANNSISQYDMYFYFDRTGKLRYENIDGLTYLFETCNIQNMYVCKTLSLVAIKNGNKITIHMNNQEYVFNLNGSNYLLNEICSGFDKLVITKENGAVTKLEKKTVLQVDEKEKEVVLEKIEVSLSEDTNDLLINYYKNNDSMTYIYCTKIIDFKEDARRIKRYIDETGNAYFDFSIEKNTSGFTFTDNKMASIKEFVTLNTSLDVTKYIDKFGKEITFQKERGECLISNQHGNTLHYVCDNFNLNHIKNELNEVQTFAYTKDNRIQSSVSFSLNHLNHLGKQIEARDRWTTNGWYNSDANITCPFTGEIITGTVLDIYEEEDNDYEYREEVTIPAKKGEVKSLLLYILGNGVVETEASMDLKIDFYDIDDNLLESSDVLEIDNYGEDKFYYYSFACSKDYAYYQVVLQNISGVFNAVFAIYHFNGGIGSTYKYDSYGLLKEVIQGNEGKSIYNTLIGTNVNYGSTKSYEDDLLFFTKQYDNLGNTIEHIKEYTVEGNDIIFDEDLINYYDGKMIGTQFKKYKKNTRNVENAREYGTENSYSYDSKSRVLQDNKTVDDLLKTKTTYEYNDSSAFYPDSLKSKTVYNANDISFGKNEISVSNTYSNTFLKTSIKNDSSVSCAFDSDKFSRLNKVSYCSMNLETIEYDETFPNNPRRVNKDYFIYDEKGRVIKKAYESLENTVSKVNYNNEGNIIKISYVDTEYDAPDVTTEYETYYKEIEYRDGIIKQEVDIDTSGDEEAKVLYARDKNFAIKGYEVESGGKKGYVEHSISKCEVADLNDLYGYVSTYSFDTITSFFYEKQMIMETDENKNKKAIKNFALVSEKVGSLLEPTSTTILRPNEINGVSCVDVSNGGIMYSNINANDFMLALYIDNAENDVMIFRINEYNPILCVLNGNLLLNESIIYNALPIKRWNLIRFKKVDSNFEVYLNESLVTTFPCVFNEIAYFTVGGKTADYYSKASPNQGVYITMLTFANVFDDEFANEIKNKIDNINRIHTSGKTIDFDNLKTSEYIKTQSHIELDDTYEDYISLHNDTVSKNDVDAINSLPFDKNSNDKNFVYDEGIRSFVLTKALSYILPITTTGTISINAKRKNVTTTKDDILSLSGKIELKCDNAKLYLSSSDSNANATYKLSNDWNKIIISYSKLVASASIDTYPYSVKVYVDGTLLINTTLQLKYDITSNITMHLSDAFKYEGIKYSESILGDDCNPKYDVISKYNTSGNIFNKVISDYSHIRLTSDYIYDDKNRLIQEQTFLGNNEINIYYEYDENNRITSINRTENDVVQDHLVFTYDSLGRLSKAGQYGSTESFNFDKKGNIYFRGGKKFTYDGLNRLSSYNGITITYASGNMFYPTSISNSNGTISLSWYRDKLSSYVDENGVATTFTYNQFELRKTKISQGTTYHYNYDSNGRLISERRNTNNVATIYLYYYDESDRLIGYSRNNEMFFYLRDAQGVIYAIINSVGNIVARYTYDAYGKVLTSTGTEANNNFIRYKGYYYDVETQLYWLSSRYYSPELGRFIQPADVSSLNPSSINGLNLYSYANNNPIDIAYSSSGVSGTANGEMVSSVALGGISNGGPLGGLNSSGGSGFLGNFISGASSLHGGIDKISSYLAGSVDGLLTYMNNPKYKGFHKKLNSYSDWLMGIGIGLDIASSAYNNYMNPNLTSGQKWASFGLDVGYIAVTSYLSYKAGDLLAKGAVALGVLVGGVPGGIIVVVGIVAGTVLIAVISDALDNWWEKKKEEWFN